MKIFHDISNTIIYYRLYLISGSNRWYGSIWTPKVFERINEQWIEKCEMGVQPGRLHYIGEMTLPSVTDGILLDSNRTMLMHQKCMRFVMDKPSHVNLTFPQANNCWWTVNVKMQSQLDCPGVSLDMTLQS